ncbi:MAG: hypothetical protein JSR49_09155 [Proteobacteria bacterium]|nr:hypothetical protein [Pseudomonadota bacterium]
MQGFSTRGVRTLVCLLAILPVALAWAQPRREGREHEFRGPGPVHARPAERYEFRGHDVRRFDEPELRHWRGGFWRNSCYGGRCGWWWASGGQWYFYDRPVYPYPLLVSGIVVAAPVVVAPPAVMPAQPAPLVSRPVLRHWYYCDNPPGYFPAVQSCSVPFREVAPPPPPPTPPTQ